MLLGMLHRYSVNAPRRISAHSSKLMQHSGLRPEPVLQANCFSTSNSANWQAAPPGRPKVIIITGPTAVGKTKLSLEVAKRIGGEIISADSVQVYRGLDVGSDKIPVDQREGIPHHLIDILPADAEFSAGDFSRLARKAAEDIIQRGRVPVVVGGTGFYLRWFIYGKAATPPSAPETAAKVVALVEQAWQKAAAAAAAAQTQQHAAVAAAALVGGQQQQQQQSVGQIQQSTDADAAADAAAVAATAALQPRWGSVHPTVSPEAAQYLTEDQRWDAAVDIVQDLGDTQTATRIRAERNNWYRLQRVLQILLQNGGKPLSELDIDTTKPLDYDFRCFFLHRPRLELFDRIIYRVEEMVESGLLAEALMLLDMGLAPNSNVATKAIGYRQACEFMQRALCEGAATKQQLQQLILDIGTASRNLVRHQIVWFRDDDLFRWLEVGSKSTEDVLKDVIFELEQPQHAGGCGDNGRLDKETEKALKRYVPKLKLFCEDQRVEQVLQWVKVVAQERQ